MVYCVQGSIIFPTVARRDAARDDLETFIVNRERWSADSIGSSVNRDGLPILAFDLRFVAEVNAQALRDRIKSFLVGQRVPRDDSRLWGHRCRHDEGDGGCGVQEEWVVQNSAWTRTV